MESLNQFPKGNSINGLERGYEGGVMLFGLASLLWLGIGVGLCQFLGSDAPNPFLSSLWMGVLWALSLADLVILAKLLSLVLLFLNSEPGHQSDKIPRAIQAFTWGLLKLVCLGLFVLILLKGQKIPMHGLLLGMGTLAVVPLTGGFVWSQRMLRHA